MMQHPWHAQHALKFCKMYAAVGSVINEALAQYRDEVRQGQFPGMQFSPYQISAEEEDMFLKRLHEGFDRERRAVGASFDQPQKEVDSSTTSLYGGGSTTTGKKQH